MAEWPENKDDTEVSQRGGAEQPSRSVESDELNKDDGSPDAESLQKTGQEIRISYLKSEQDDHPGHQLVSLPDGTATRLPPGTFRSDDPVETIEEMLEAAAVGLCSGCEILVPGGPKPIESLAAGDNVTTDDGTTQEIRWIGRRRIKAQGLLAPIALRSGALGQHDALTVMPQQRLLIQDWRADLLFGEPEVLVPARYLVDGTSVTKTEGGETDVFLMLFDRHCTIRANRCPTESFLPNEQALTIMDDDQRADILSICPRLRVDPLNGYGRDVRPTLRRWEVKYLMK
ncbi:MAG: Hint domain-containing protein [Pseudomonadota bacterium]